MIHSHSWPFEPFPGTDITLRWSTMVSCAQWHQLQTNYRGFAPGPHLGTSVPPSPDLLCV